MSGLPHGLNDDTLRPGKDYELRGNEIVAVGGIMTDKLREAAANALIALRKMAKEESTSVRLKLGIEASIALNTALFADTADAPENDQMVRAREQAGGLDHWARCLEAHEPESSAAGILMLRAAAKTLRELAAEN